MSKPIKAKPSSCPMCGEKTVEAYRPFCSRACKMKDLNNWLSGNYAIPGEKASPQHGQEEDE